MYRPVLAQICTISDVKKMTYMEMHEINQFLDMQGDIEMIQNEYNFKEVK